MAAFRRASLRSLAFGCHLSARAGGSNRLEYMIHLRLLLQFNHTPNRGQFKVFACFCFDRMLYMGPYVHRLLTYNWAVETGFSPEEAETISGACVGIDAKHHTKPWAHFRVTGADIISFFLMRRALRQDDLLLLGYAIHAAQDAIGHGWILPFLHMPMLDDWKIAPKKIKLGIETKTLAMLTRYRNYSSPSPKTRQA
jgi:hypothetical protein